MNIREATPADLASVLAVERLAFGRDDEANFTDAMLKDPSAQPTLSLLAIDGEQPIGHILFTKAHIEGAPELPAAFLAPLAVVPEFQRRGVGGELIRQGLLKLREGGVDLVFVVGHPTYYPRFGFEVAGKVGFMPTYPMRAEAADAWMVLALKDGVVGSVSGRVVCCDALNKPEVWRE